MELDESAAPYRGFLRSGSYPALSKRIVNSGGLLVRAAGWFALIVTAASAGYNMTQRFMAQSATAVRPQLAAAAAHADRAPEPRALQPQESPHEDAPLQEHKAEASKRAAAPVLPAKRRQVETGAIPAVAQQQHTLPELTNAEVEESHTAQPTVIAEPVRALEANSAPDLTVEEPAVTETQHVAAAHSGEATVSPFHPSARAFAPRPAPRTAPPPAAQPKSTLPLTATARIDGLAVNGSLTSATVRHGLERVQPTLSECYASAARRAGENRFSDVRVLVQFDEAGRVKSQPSVEGAQLPGLGACLSAAFSKLVCRAPDTGTAKASMTLHFGPMALAATQRR